jgi:hypothetical protein
MIVCCAVAYAYLDGMGLEHDTRPGLDDGIVHVFVMHLVYEV